MFRGYNFRQRTVIDAETADRIGVVSDVEIDELSGRISKLIVRRKGGWFGGVFGLGEFMIPWSAITAVGKEYILVKSFNLSEKCLKNNSSCDIIK